MSRPSRMVQGLGGHPGIRTSGSRSAGASRPEASAQLAQPSMPPAQAAPAGKSPPEMAHAPTATSSLGSGTECQASRKAGSMFLEIGPVRTRASAWRGA